jgi:hypothetical protein
MLNEATISFPEYIMFIIQKKHMKKPLPKKDMKLSDNHTTGAYLTFS